MVWGLGLRVPTWSLFHDENFCISDFGVRGTVNFEDFDGGSALIFEKWGFDCRRGAPASQSEGATRPRSGGGKTPIFQTLRRNS